MKNEIENTIQKFVRGDLVRVNFNSGPERNNSLIGLVLYKFEQEYCNYWTVLVSGLLRVVLGKEISRIR